MTDYEDESDEAIDELGRNATQQRMDETGESESDELVDLDWSDGDEEDASL